MGSTTFAGLAGGISISWPSTVMRAPASPRVITVIGVRRRRSSSEIPIFSAIMPNS